MEVVDDFIVESQTKQIKLMRVQSIVAFIIHYFVHEDRITYYCIGDTTYLCLSFVQNQ